MSSVDCAISVTLRATSALGSACATAGNKSSNVEKTRLRKYTQKQVQLQQVQLPASPNSAVSEIQRLGLMLLDIPLLPVHEACILTLDGL